jgi:hypothetical protein
MGAHLDDPSAFDHHDAVSIPYSGQPMGDDYRCAVV